MNDFKSWYLALLRKQVEEELQFLTANGHAQTFITEPCIFCVPSHSNNSYHCRRMKDLKEFLSNIMQHIRNHATNKGRVPIGCEPRESGSHVTLEHSTMESKLPLMFPEL